MTVVAGDEGDRLPWCSFLGDGEKHFIFGVAGVTNFMYESSLLFITSARDKAAVESSTVFTLTSRVKFVHGSQSFFTPGDITTPKSVNEKKA